MQLKSWQLNCQPTATEKEKEEKKKIQHGSQHLLIVCFPDNLLTSEIQSDVLQHQWIVEAHGLQCFFSVIIVSILRT